MGDLIRAPVQRIVGERLSLERDRGMIGPFRHPLLKDFM
jgi:hypothetical protein